MMLQLHHSLSNNGNALLDQKHPPGPRRQCQQSCSHGLRKHRWPHKSVGNKEKSSRNAFFCSCSSVYNRHFCIVSWFCLLHIYLIAFYCCSSQGRKQMSHFNFTYSAVSKLLGVFNLFNLTTKLDGTVNVADGKLSHGTHQVTCVLFPKWWQCPLSSIMAWGPNRAAILSQITLVSTGVASAL